MAQPQPYLNTHILECNRVYSAEYNNKDTEEGRNAIWTNHVNSGLRLDIGDKVSLHSAFISDLGAEDSTIEFTGNVVQDKQVFEVSKYVPIETADFGATENNASELHPRYYLSSRIEEHQTTLYDIKDTDVNMLVSYYKTNNGENMFHLPIRYALPTATHLDDPNNSWFKKRTNADVTTGTCGAVSASHIYAGDYNWDSTGEIRQLNVDGNRYAIFGRDATDFIQLTDGAFVSNIQYRDIFTKYHKYIRIRELLSLKVPQGFNSPTQISTVITEQLQEQTPISRNTINYKIAGSDIITKKKFGPQNETTVNKLFSCATATNLNASSSFAFYGVSATEPTKDQLSYNHYTAYQYIGIKRPELYETGIEIKEINTGVLTEADFKDIFTSTISPSSVNVSFAVATDNSKDYGGMENINPFHYQYVDELPFGMVGIDEDTPILSEIKTNYAWTDDNLQKFKAFFDAQKRYPELFDMDVSRNELLYNKKLYNASEYAGEEISINTHRFLHMNAKKNASQARELMFDGQTGGASLDIGQVSFGYDNIASIFSTSGTHYGVPNTYNVDMSSVPLFVKYYEKYENDTGPAEDFGFEFDENSGKGLWGGFAKRQSSTLVFRDEGGVITINDEDTGPNSSFNKTDRISFLAVVPKKYLHQEVINTYHDSDGSASDVIQTQNVYTLGKIDWYSQILNNEPPFGDIDFLLNVDTVKIGFDSHPTAYGNAYIGLYNGLCGERGVTRDRDFYTAIDQNNPLTYMNATSDAITVNPTVKYVDEWCNKIYCGAIEPELSFDSNSARFALSSLHSPERITPKYDATLVKTATAGDKSKLSEGQVVPVPDSSGNECYKINKLFDYRNFCPTITPYFREVGVDIQGTTTNDFFAKTLVNHFVVNNSIIDSNSGIFIEDFNITEENWNNSFWGICGFSYDNLNNKNTGNINERVFDSELGTIAKLTTNANVKNDDLGKWDGFGTGVPSYKYHPSYPAIMRFQGEHGHDASNAVAYAPLEVVCESVKIEASNLPTKTLRPYFVVRSDIISDSYFIGGKMAPTLMPVLSVIPKESQYGDFYFGNDPIEFTITYPRTITSITTQITDPSGELSNLSPNSSILYKIQKSKISNAQILQQVLQANSKKKSNM